MEKDICCLIQQTQNNDKEALLQIINRFYPLIIKYTKKLNYEDAKHDMILFFITMIKKIDLEQFKTNFQEYKLLGFIKESVYHQYLLLAKKHQNYNNTNFFVLDTEYGEQNYFYDNLDSIINMRLFYHNLKSKEQYIFRYKYIYGYADKEIAAFMGISRQMVNRYALRIKEKLRMYMD